MTPSALIKTVAAAVLCGTGATAGIAFYPTKGAAAVWIAAVAVAAGFILAAVPVKGRAK